MNEPQWPDDIGTVAPKLMVCALLKAAATFPVGTGLGWDAIHPRAIARLSEQTLLWLVEIIRHCEIAGRWPIEVAVVIIALLPKSDGGLRPIGLVPFLPRLWCRVRKHVATEWERANRHPFLYAGKGMGANVAAWKQAARAELAATSTFRVGYAQALLDLVMAFDRIPHWLIVREAHAIGFPLWFIKLSLATYKLTRVVRIQQVVSHEVVVVRGIAAGSGSACTEMKLVLIRIILTATKATPHGHAVLLR